MPYKYRDMKWSEMDDKQREKAGSKSEHKAAKEKAQKVQATTESQIANDKLAAENKANAQAVIEADRAAAQKNPTPTTPGLEFPTPTNSAPANLTFPEPVKSSNNSSNNSTNNSSNNSASSTSNNSSTSSSQNAVEKTKTWAEMSKAERKATGMSKKEYNRQDQKSGMTANYDVDNLSDFDLAGGGAGAQKGTERLSYKDLQGLDATGNFSREELINYADDVTKTFDDNDQGFGNKADKLLQSWKDGLTSVGGGGEDTIPGGGDTVPGGGGDTVPGGGDTVPGGGDTVPGGGDTVPGGGDTVPGGTTNPGDFLDDRITDIIDNGGNVNIQDVTIDQSNVQDQSIIQDNDINSEVIGDYNDTTINQDNTATNIGGNQGNSAGVSNTNDAGAQDLLNEYVTGINTNPGISNGSAGDLNAQVVDVEQDNTQTQSIEQDNDIDSLIQGDNNTTEINQDNSASNIGGDQGNASVVTNSSESQAQDLLGSYIRTADFQDGNGNGIDDRDENTPDINEDSPIVPEDSGPDYSTLAGQDLTDPSTFVNFQQVQSGQDNTQTQGAQQDNDINSTITGDNNYTNINQDNSVRNYGGDQRNFTYVANNDNPYTNTPASMATMAGFYEVTDSPGSQAAFVDRFTTQNADNQKRYDNVGMANDMIYRANSVSPIDTNAFEDSLNQRSELARARAGAGFANVFGDIANFPQFSWNSPDRQSGVESPNFEELANNISDGF